MMLRIVAFELVLEFSAVRYLLTARSPQGVLKAENLMVGQGIC